MTATFREAQDEMLALFKTVWDATGHPALYENVADDPPTTATPWARITLQHFPGGQRSLAGEAGARRWERNGQIIVQVFTPIGKGTGEAYDLAKIVADAYEGKATASQVWFRGVRVNNIGPDGAWFQLNVIVQFTYDEVK